MSFYLKNNYVEVGMLGDSIIAQMGPRQADFAAPFAAASNLGISGAILSTIAGNVSSLTSTSTHVILEGGTNDLLNIFNSDVVSQYTAILNAIPSTKRVIVMGVLPVDEAALNISHPPPSDGSASWRDWLNNKIIHDKNVELIALCKTYANCVAATGVMSLNVSGQTLDGIHPLEPLDLKIIKLLTTLLDPAPRPF